MRTIEDDAARTSDRDLEPRAVPATRGEPLMPEAAPATMTAPAPQPAAGDCVSRLDGGGVLDREALYPTDPVAPRELLGLSFQAGSPAAGGSAEHAPEPQASTGEASGAGR